MRNCATVDTPIARDKPPKPPDEWVASDMLSRPSTWMGDVSSSLANLFESADMGLYSIVSRKPASLRNQIRAPVLGRTMDLFSRRTLPIPSEKHENCS